MSKQVDFRDVTPPPALLNDRLGGCFGMCEMEIAAMVIVAKCVQAGTWHTNIDRTMFISADLNNYSMDGFDELIEHEWLERKHGDHWQVVSDFVKRLIKNRPDAFTLETDG